MAHYICTGECETVSQKPGICEAAGCLMRQQPLEPCECTDGEHQGLSEIEEIEEEQEEEE